MLFTCHRWPFQCSYWSWICHQLLFLFVRAFIYFYLSFYSEWQSCWNTWLVIHLVQYFLFQYFISCRVLWEKSSINLTPPPHMWSLDSSCDCKQFVSVFYSSHFNYKISWCCFIWVTLVGIPWASWISIPMSLFRLGKFSPIISSISLFFPHFLNSYDCEIVSTGVDNNLSYILFIIFSFSFWFPLLSCWHCLLYLQV